MMMMMMARYRSVFWITLLIISNSFSVLSSPIKLLSEPIDIETQSSSVKESKPVKRHLPYLKHDYQDSASIEDELIRPYSTSFWDKHLKSFSSEAFQDRLSNLNSWENRYNSDENLGSPHHIYRPNSRRSDQQSVIVVNQRPEMSLKKPLSEILRLDDSYSSSDININSGLDSSISQESDGSEQQNFQDNPNYNNNLMKNVLKIVTYVQKKQSKEFGTDEGVKKVQWGSTDRIDKENEESEDDCACNEYPIDKVIKQLVDSSYEDIEKRHIQEEQFNAESGNELAADKSNENSEKENNFQDYYETTTAAGQEETTTGQVEETTTDHVQETTSDHVEETTTDHVEETTTDQVKETTTDQVEETTTSHVEETTTDQHEQTTSGQEHVTTYGQKEENTSSVTENSEQIGENKKETDSTQNKFPTHRSPEDLLKAIEDLLDRRYKGPGFGSGPVHNNLAHIQAFNFNSDNRQDTTTEDSLSNLHQSQYEFDGKSSDHIIQPFPEQMSVFGPPRFDEDSGLPLFEPIVNPYHMNNENDNINEKTTQSSSSGNVNSSDSDLKSSLESIVVPKPKIEEAPRILIEKLVLVNGQPAAHITNTDGLHISPGPDGNFGQSPVLQMSHDLFQSVMKVVNYAQKGNTPIISTNQSTKEEKKIDEISKNTDKGNTHKGEQNSNVSEATDSEGWNIKTSQTKASKTDETTVKHNEDSTSDTVHPTEAEIDNGKQDDGMVSNEDKMEHKSDVIHNDESDSFKEDPNPEEKTPKSSAEGSDKKEEENLSEKGNPETAIKDSPKDFDDDSPKVDDSSPKENDASPKANNDSLKEIGNSSEENDGFPEENDNSSEENNSSFKERESSSVVNESIQEPPKDNEGSPKGNEDFRKKNEGSLEDNAGTLKKTESSPKDNESFPKNNESSLKDNEGSSKDNEDFPKESQGFPKDNEGSPKENEGFPKDSEGVPKDNESPLKDNEGSLKNTEGTPKDNEDFPRNNEGSPKDNEGSPKNNEGSLKDNQGTPKDNESSPKVNEGSPKANEGLPKNNEGSLEDNAGTLKKTESSPKDNESFPKNNESSLKDNEGSSKDNEGSPKNNEDSPKDNGASEKDNGVSPKDSEDFPKDNEGSPKDNEDSPKDNEGSPKDSEGSPKDNEDSQNANEGFPKNNEGSLKDNAGTPEDNAGTPKDTESSPKDSEDSPKANEGFPKNNEGSLNDNAGTPEDNAGTPKDNAGTPKDTESSPKDNEDSPKANEGFPKNNEGSLNDNAGTPEDNAGTPKDTESSPKDNEDSPKANEGFPKNNEGSLNDNAGTPEDNAGTPKDTESSPKDNEDSPKANEGFPKNNEGSLNDNAGTPEDNAGTPEDNSGTPKDTEISPKDNEDSPKANEGFPKNNEGSLNDNAGTPEDNAGTPKDTESSPKDNEDSPKANEGFPKNNEGSLNDNVGTPEDNAGTPKDTESSPKDNEGYPKTNEGSPKDNEGSPKINEDSPKDNGASVKDSEDFLTDNEDSSKDSDAFPKANGDSSKSNINGDEKADDTSPTKEDSTEKTEEKQVSVPASSDKQTDQNEDRKDEEEASKKSQNVDDAVSSVFGNNDKGETQTTGERVRVTDKDGNVRNTTMEELIETQFGTKDMFNFVSDVIEEMRQLLNSNEKPEDAEKKTNSTEGSDGKQNIEKGPKTPSNETVVQNSATNGDNDSKGLDESVMEVFGMQEKTTNPSEKQSSDTNSQLTQTTDTASEVRVGEDEEVVDPPFNDFDTTASMISDPEDKSKQDPMETAASENVFFTTTLPDQSELRTMSTDSEHVTEEMTTGRIELMTTTDISSVTTKQEPEAPISHSLPQQKEPTPSSLVSADIVSNLIPSESNVVFQILRPVRLERIVHDNPSPSSAFNLESDARINEHVKQILKKLDENIFPVTESTFGLINNRGDHNGNIYKADVVDGTKSERAGTQFYTDFSPYNHGFSNAIIQRMTAAESKPEEKKTNNSDESMSHTLGEVPPSEITKTQTTLAESNETTKTSSKINSSLENTFEKESLPLKLQIPLILAGMKLNNVKPVQESEHLHPEGLPLIDDLVSPRLDSEHSQLRTASENEPISTNEIRNSIKDLFKGIVYKTSPPQIPSNDLQPEASTLVDDILVRPELVTSSSNKIFENVPLHRNIIQATEKILEGTVPRTVSSISDILSDVIPTASDHNRYLEKLPLMDILLPSELNSEKIFENENLVPKMKQNETQNHVNLTSLLLLGAENHRTSDKNSEKNLQHDNKILSSTEDVLHAIVPEITNLLSIKMKTRPPDVVPHVTDVIPKSSNYVQPKMRLLMDILVPSGHDVKKVTPEVENSKKQPDILTELLDQPHSEKSKSFKDNQKLPEILKKILPEILFNILPENDSFPISSKTLPGNLESINEKNEKQSIIVDKMLPNGFLEDKLDSTDNSKNFKPELNTEHEILSSLTIKSKDDSKSLDKDFVRNIPEENQIHENIVPATPKLLNVEYDYLSKDGAHSPSQDIHLPLQKVENNHVNHLETLDKDIPPTYHDMHNNKLDMEQNLDDKLSPADLWEAFLAGFSHGKYIRRRPKTDIEIETATKEFLPKPEILRHYETDKNPVFSHSMESNAKANFYDHKDHSDSAIKRDRRAEEPDEYHWFENYEQSVTPSSIYGGGYVHSLSKRSISDIDNSEKKEAGEGSQQPQVSEQPQVSQQPQVRQLPQVSEQPQVSENGQLTKPIIGSSTTTACPEDMACEPQGLPTEIMNTDPIIEYLNAHYNDEVDPKVEGVFEENSEEYKKACEKRVGKFLVEFPSFIEEK